MKSKKLFFDTTILKRNFKQYWPVWGGYLFVMLWVMPAVISINFSLSFNTSLEERKLDMMEYILEFAASEGGLIIATIIGLIAGMSMFSYLHKERSCYFYHSLPITRGRLFATDYISGLMMMLVPNLITALLIIAATASKGYACVKEAFEMFIIFSAIELFFYTFAVLCMVITGQKITAFVLYCIFLFYVPGMLLLMNDMIGQMFFGVTEGNLALPGGVLEIFSPVRFCYNIQVRTIYDEVSYGRIGYMIESDNWFRVLELFIVSLILITAAVLLHRIRKSETAGDLICYKYAKPVFAWGVGLSFGVIISDFLLNSLFSSMSGTTGIKAVGALCLIITCLMGYIIAQMLLNKTFRIFQTEKKGMFIFGAVVAVLSVIFVIDITDIAGYVPKADELERAEITTYRGYVSYQTDNQKNSVEDITAVHKAILRDRDRVYDGNHSNWGGESLQYVRFTYITKKGVYIQRTYYIKEADAQLTGLVKDFEYSHRLDYLFNGTDAKSITKASYTYMTLNGDYVERDVYGYKSKELFDAIRNDVASDYLDVEYARGEKRYYYSATEEFYHNYADDEFFYQKYLYYALDPNTNTMEKMIGYGHPLHIEFEAQTENGYTNHIEIYYHDGCLNTRNCIDALNISEGFSDDFIR